MEGETERGVGVLIRADSPYLPMHVDHHPLVKEFPEMRERIHTLRSSSTHFANLAEQYEEVDKHICRAEDSPEGYAEGHMHELKAKRLHLKDLLYSELSTSV